MRKVYRGTDVEVSFDLDICIHIGECLRGHAGVFKLDRRPWVLPDAADGQDIASTWNGIINHQNVNVGYPPAGIPQAVANAVRVYQTSFRLGNPRWAR